MEYTLLGRSGIGVSVVGLGGGGPSRLGQRQGKSKKESVALIRQALLNMFAVRRALSQPAVFTELWGEIRQKGLVDPRFSKIEDLLEFLLKEGIASTIPEAAYRYCRHEPGVHVVLTGTGNPEHLEANVSSLLKPPLLSVSVRSSLT